MAGKSTATPSVVERLQTLLAASVERHRVPGASLAVRVGERVYEAAAGWANPAARIDATPDTVFHFGSVTKILTATLIARLVDQGRIDLDAPIVRYVPEFSPPDPFVAKALTVRHCLSHTAGLASTLFVDTGRNDDTVERQVDVINLEPQFHPPGALLSYCNSGIVLLGRVIERLLGKPWHAVIVEDLAQPLGMAGVVTRPEHALRGRYAVGHLFDAQAQEWIADPHPFWMPGHAPAGSTCAGRARDLVALATLHLDAGRTHDGAQFLSEAVVRAMQERVSIAPVPFLYRGFGLGWMLYDWCGTPIIGHDGATAGTKAFLRIDPQRRVAAALLVNCHAGLPVYEDLFGEIFRETSGTFEPGAPPHAAAGDLSMFEGCYVERNMRFDLERHGEGMRLEMMPVVATPLTRAHTQRLELHPCGPGQFYVDDADAMLGVPNPPADTRLVRPYVIVEAAGTTWLHTGQSALQRRESK